MFAENRIAKYSNVSLKWTPPFSQKKVPIMRVVHTNETETCAQFDPEILSTWRDIHVNGVCVNQTMLYKQTLNTM